MQNIHIIISSLMGTQLTPFKITIAYITLHIRINNTVNTTKNIHKENHTICLNILQTVASGKTNFHKHYKSKIEIIQWSFVYIQNRSKMPYSTNYWWNERRANKINILLFKWKHYVFHQQKSVLSKITHKYNEWTISTKLRRTRSVQLSFLAVSLIVP